MPQADENTKLLFKTTLHTMKEQSKQKVNVEQVPMIVAQADDLKMIGNDAIIAKRDKTNGWLNGAMVLFFVIAVFPGIGG
ncbi:hypothetical protein BSR08_02790 [Bacillus subtilis]|nr:hypothetical protein BSR08_02790 [Bacillus subtilis]BAI84755.1 hypothetical protein BSNT_07645 [Bacillus subtilis subsp. natto BEST195]GAK78805.1 hypothetical protein BSMD_007070 [Bacillus subtilis Miyagi-4]